MKYLLIFGLAFVLGLLIINIAGVGVYFLTILPFLIYSILIGVIVWFAISFIKLQRERNEILADIANKLEKL
ncbi:hypothetical protein DS745_03765 [Anaerobacillus alkaliphilus]|uniref:Uncharacterized protein n=1 Tax=Anaerobacillus alkaliphilus TaxID=1548597 RepID=A0A4Q0VYG7_9BACI|nr:hypothetical protein [Anaerobacillus alkaliphilus]RXJ04510.1 hypothetical protein DS745_03765 [Anaerobacillus alkaliphilus]